MPFLYCVWGHAPLFSPPSCEPSVIRSQSRLDVLRPSQRLLLVGVGGVLLGLLVTAAAIKPDERGYGTHQRLGLPPCTFKVVTGVRCPSCGMTTSWSYLVRGQIVNSVKSNCGGAFLGLLVIVMVPWALLSGIRGRWLWRPFNERTALVAALTLISITLIDWSVRFFVGS
jgi:hypothetical protein